MFLLPRTYTIKNMAIAERTVPADTDILCERCGYTLNGLPDTGNCPECGDAIANSLSQDGRTLSEYESDPRPRTFWKTTFRVIFDTKRFYRTLRGRVEDEAKSKRFSGAHRWIVSVFFALCATGHGLWLLQMMGYPLVGFEGTGGLISGLFVFAGLVGFTFMILSSITRLAQWLTTIEARYWGFRLSLPVVRRAMRFHSANYLPVGVVAAACVCGYQLLRHFRIIGFAYDTWYIYGLCALVVLSAGYLFQTYWIGMKNLMYANR